MSTSKEIKFSNEALELVAKMISRYPEGKQKSALLPVLHLAQAEFDGWLSPEVMDYVAELLSIQPIEVYEVASFYSMFNLKPVGKCLLEVCRTSSCWLRGANEIVEHIEKKLGIKEGETTPDGMFTLKTVECLGSCGTAPMMMCGAQFHENLTFQKVDSILDQLKSEGKRKTYLDDVTVNHY
ncbi:MAG: NADH-quinone oxidoreductase subunit NuoE [Bacteroidetes bacterium]|nr:NADH-quinone oxidoreductase subunit NuoE [Bacteroidota bacterium]MCK6610014.1 NADH-quinone oxidoreductase subunit NuoE [Bacteroidia bacterium]